MAERQQTTHIVVHCSATPPTQDIGAKEIDRWHRAQGYMSIGYHAVIRRDGTIETGRGLNKVGAHAREGGYNRTSIGVCLVGGVSEKPQAHVPGNPWNGSNAENNFTEAQRLALFAFIKDVWEQYGQRLPVIGHRDIPGVSKACPSFSVSDWMKEAFPEEFPEVYPEGFPSRWASQ